MNAILPRKTLTWAVHVDGALVTRDRAREWPEDDPMRRIVLESPEVTLNDGDANFRGGPMRATRLAARLKIVDPDALVTVVLWEAED